MQGGGVTLRTGPARGYQALTLHCYGQRESWALAGGIYSCEARHHLRGFLSWPMPSEGAETIL